MLNLKPSFVDDSNFLRHCAISHNLTLFKEFKVMKRRWEEEGPTRMPYSRAEAINSKHLKGWKWKPRRKWGKLWKSSENCTLTILLVLDWEVNKYGFSLHNKIQNENLDFKIRKDLQQEEDLILSWMRLFLCFSNTVK